MSTIDSRLRLCADFVRQGSKLADIGTDHAYLPVWLCRIGRCPSAIASDINPEPLKRGQETITNADMNSIISTRLGAGLEKISPDEADDIVIAGMGGELIASIIDSWQYSKDNSKRFILQPMTKSEALIENLYTNGFEIIKQDCCIAANKCYTVLCVQWTGHKEKADEVFCYLGKLNPKENETHKSFVLAHINRLEKQANADKHYGELADILKKLLSDNND